MNPINQVRIAFRRIFADKLNFFISLTGLVLGLAIVAVITVYVFNEFSYNQSFANTDRIYRVLNFNENDDNTWANTPFVLSEVAKEQFAEIEEAVHQYVIRDVEVEKNTEYIEEPLLLCTESSFFRAFGVEVLQGSLNDFDHDQTKILISKSSATKYFGSENPVGKILQLKHQGKEFDLEVAAIFKDIPRSSTVKAPFIVNIDFGAADLTENMIGVGDDLREFEIKEDWVGVYFSNYFLLKEGTSVEQFQTKLEQLGKLNETDNNALEFSLQAFPDIYFHSQKIIDNNSSDLGNLQMVFLLMFVAVLILFIACINYLNLSLAKTIQQWRNFAVRSVCGASRKSLIGQLVLESALISTLALPFALIFAQLLLPFIGQLLGKSYTLSLVNHFAFIVAILFAIALTTGAISGLFVALRFSAINILQILKGSIAKGRAQFSFRQGMVVFQLTVFIILISMMFLVQKQVQYSFSKDLGFVKEGLIRIPLGDHDLKLFKQEALKNPNVESISGTLWMPPSDNRMYISIPRVDDRTEQVKVSGLFVDYHFAETMGMRILMGSDFDEQGTNTGVLVNESAIKTLGLTDVLGEQTAFGPVVGVVSDFNMFSLHDAITPMVIGLNPGMSKDVAIRINTANFQKTIQALKTVWENSGGSTPFNFEITDDILRRMYEEDIHFSKTIGLLAAIAILISSLGLFGLSLLMSRQRTKEIGIRKVNGAKISEVMAMLNKDFVKWVASAFVIATPIAWFAMNKWLENFAYKTNLSWWIFALAGILALGIALLTVSWQSWRAATRNPVDALRYE